MSEIKIQFKQKYGDILDVGYGYSNSDVFEGELKEVIRRLVDIDQKCYKYDKVNVSVDLMDGYVEFIGVKNEE